MNDNQNNNPGSLGMLLRLFGLGPAAAPGLTGPLPYRVRDDFLSAAERSFYGILVSAVAGRGVVFCKVRLADIFFVSRPNENAAARNRIDRKHADFVVCDPAAGLPLVRVLAQRAYSVAEITVLVVPHLVAGLPVTPARPPDPAPATGTAPPCPVCGIPMVARTASRGERTGEQFWGCPNYPRCRRTVPLSPM